LLPSGQYARMIEKSNALKLLWRKMSQKL